MNQSLKQIIIALIVIAVAFFGFQAIFKGGDTNMDPSITSQAAKGQFIDGQATLALLKKLSVIELNEKILSDSVFLSLVSFEQAIPDQVIARPNPFAPIGSEISTTQPR